MVPGGIQAGTMSAVGPDAEALLVAQVPRIRNQEGKVCDACLRRCLGCGAGVVIVDLDGSRDIFMKLREGDVITGINNRKIDNLRDFSKALKYVNPNEGMFLDIQRNGYPMYVSVSGADQASGRRPVDIPNPHPFSMTEIAPILRRDIDVGGMNVEAGIVGKQVENWIEKNFGRGFHVCPNCGTLVPNNMYSNNRRIYCPNCGNRMVSKR